jgi:ketosteroid isomerase-like protein
MSQENVERIRDAYAAFNRSDFEGVGRAFHPDAEWRPYLGIVEGSVHRGRDAILKMWQGLQESFGGTFRTDVLELVDCGDQVVIVVEAHARGSGSGAEVRQSWAQLATLEDGLIVRVEPYPDRAAALAAAGS